MEQEPFDRIKMKDKIINAFRPIEQLVKIMDRSSPEVPGDMLRSHGEIGMALCMNFHRTLDSMLGLKIQEAKDEQQ